MYVTVLVLSSPTLKDQYNLVMIDLALYSVSLSERMTVVGSLSFVLI